VDCVILTDLVIDRLGIWTLPRLSSTSQDVAGLSTNFFYHHPPHPNLFLL